MILYDFIPLFIFRGVIAIISYIYSELLQLDKVYLVSYGWCDSTAFWSAG